MLHRTLMALAVLFAFLFSGSPAFSNSSSDLISYQQCTVVESQISITELSSLSIFYRELEKRHKLASDEKTASLWQEFELLYLAIVGQHYKNRYSYDDFRRAYSGEIKLMVPSHDSILKKDKLAYKMTLLSYSANEITDVINGRITVITLDTAIKMRMLGRSEKEIYSYLESIYRKSFNVQRNARISEKKSNAPPSKMITGTLLFDALVVRISEKYGMDPNIIRAMIKVESNWNHHAISKKGAIGLMQLMPGTARLLKVNPYNPEQNVEGGVRYFAFLCDTFKNLDLALIAYNAGPGYAERYFQRKAPLYGETLQYVQLVKNIMSLNISLNRIKM